MVFLLLLLCFFTAGRYLNIEQKPVKSDVIIVLGGGDGERALEASKLYKAHYAPYVILSNGGTRGRPSTYAAKQEIGWLIDDGVPLSAIIPELQSQSTYGNAVYTKKIMKTHRFKSAIVVSSTYHMRRSQYIFDKVFHHSNIKLIYRGAQTPGYYPTKWWTTDAGWIFTPSEYIKLIGYHIVYGLLKR